MKHQRVIHWIMFFFSIFVASRAEGPIGYSIESANGVSHVSGGTNYLTLLAAFMLVIMLGQVPASSQIANDQEHPASWKRFFACWIDLVVGISIGTAVASFGGFLLELVRTKQFHWAFERDFITTADIWIGIPLILVSMLFTFVSMAILWHRGRASFGEYLLGLQLVFDDREIPFWRYVLRSFASFLAFAGGIITVLIGKNSIGQYWQDRWLRTRMIHIDTSNAG